MTATTLDEAQKRAARLVKHALKQYKQKSKLHSIAKVTSNGTTYVAFCAQIRGLLIPMRFTDVATKQVFLPDVLWGSMITDLGDVIMPLGSFRPLNQSELDFIAEEQLARGFDKKDFALKQVKIEYRKGN